MTRVKSRVTKMRLESRLESSHESRVNTSASCHVMSRHVTSCHVMSRHVTSKVAGPRPTLHCQLTFHTQLIQIWHNRVRWLSRRVPIPGFTRIYQDPSMKVLSLMAIGRGKKHTLINTPSRSYHTASAVYTLV